jgi:bifunctional DNA-binding transcriptional regulator/antitoxin component of YhaV-PrlF toxin-antitoxin module
MARAPKSVKFKTELGKLAADYGWHFILVERKIAEKFPTDGKSRRVVCTLNGEVTFQAGLMHYHGDFFISVNKPTRTKLGLEAGDVVDVELAADESKYGLPMPDEFREILDQDPEGDELFHALTAGRQRSLLYYIAKAKDIDRRIHYGLIVIEHLKKNGGKVDGNQLSKELRRPIKEF